MAVYTEVSDDDLKAFAEAYDFGKVVSCKDIAEGVENSNYLLQTTEGLFILTLYERRVKPDDLPLFLGLMDHLADLGVPCPVPLKGRDGQALRTLCGKLAAIISFLCGMWPRRVTAEHCAKLGPALASLHNAGSGYGGIRDNSLSLVGWRTLYKSVGDAAEEIETGLNAAIGNEMDTITDTWPTQNTGPPRGIVHADLFPDNIFFLDGKCSGLIDFYFACADFCPTTSPFALMLGALKAMVHSISPRPAGYCPDTSPCGS